MEKIRPCQSIWHIEWEISVKFLKEITKTLELSQTTQNPSKSTQKTPSSTFRKLLDFATPESITAAKFPEKDPYHFKETVSLNVQGKQ